MIRRTASFKDRAVEGDRIKVEVLGRHTVSIWSYDGTGENAKTALVDLDRTEVIALRDYLTKWIDETVDRRAGLERRRGA